MVTWWMVSGTLAVIGVWQMGKGMFALDLSGVIEELFGVVCIACAIAVVAGHFLT